MTYRTRTKDQSVAWTARAWNYTGFTTQLPQPRIGPWATMTDFVTPNFRKRSRAGEVIINSMTQETISFGHSCEGYYLYMDGDPTHWEQTEGRPGLLWLGRLSAYAEENQIVPVRAYEVITASERVQADTEAATRCISDIGRSKANTWENLAEASKTLQLLRHPIDSWFKWHKKTPLVSTGSASANAYLLYRYGISPLIRDMNEIMTQAFRSVRPRWQTTHAEASVSRTADSLSYSQSGNHKWGVRKQKTETYTVRCTSIDEPIANWAYTYGLSKKQLLTLTWELIPYSFVVDWLVNTGDLIGALANAFEPKSLGRCQVGTFVGTDSRTFDSHVHLTPTVVMVRPFRGSAQAVQVLKYRGPGFSSGPGLTLKTNLRLDDATRVADAVALIAQQFTRRAIAVEKLFRR